MQPGYDETFGDNRVCKCGHTYYGHYDVPDGCKYCPCQKFE